MIIAFAGHSFIAKRDGLKEKIKELIKNNVLSSEPVSCYLGGYGAFDELCALACKELKKEKIISEVIYVTPYISLTEQAKIKEMQGCGLYDGSVYPPIENVPPRFAISKRNEWIMANADLVIAYVNIKSGGAYKAVAFARRKNKRVINICDML